VDCGVYAQATILGYKKVLKVVFDKTAFVKFNISNNFKQNIHNNKKSIGKSRSAYGF
jgi:hypothetical protein